MRNEMLNHFVKWKLNSYSTKPPLVTVMTYCISTALWLHTLYTLINLFFFSFKTSHGRADYMILPLDLSHFQRLGSNHLQVMSHLFRITSLLCTMSYWQIYFFFRCSKLCAVVPEDPEEWSLTLLFLSCRQLCVKDTPW